MSYLLRAIIICQNCDMIYYYYSSVISWEKYFIILSLREKWPASMTYKSWHNSNFKHHAWLWGYVSPVHTPNILFLEQYNFDKRYVLTNCDVEPRYFSVHIDNMEVFDYVYACLEWTWVGHTLNFLIYYDPNEWPYSTNSSTLLTSQGHGILIALLAAYWSVHGQPSQGS